MQETTQVIPGIRSRKLAVLGYIVCGLGALASLVMGYIKSLRNGLDFQWPGTHFILSGIDPWRAYLAGSNQILTQSPPNYAHELYILLLPLGAMPYAFASRAWYALTVILSLAAVWLVGQIYEMDRSRRLLLLLLLWGSLPFRNGLYAGQQAVLELVFFSLVFYLTGNLGRGIALGLSMRNTASRRCWYLCSSFGGNSSCLHGLSFRPQSACLRCGDSFMEVSPA